MCWCCEKWVKLYTGHGMRAVRRFFQDDAHRDAAVQTLESRQTLSHAHEKKCACASARTLRWHSWFLEDDEAARVLTTSRGTWVFDHFPRRFLHCPKASQDKSSTAMVIPAPLVGNLHWFRLQHPTPPTLPKSRNCPTPPAWVLVRHTLVRAPFNTPSVRKNTKTNQQKASTSAHHEPRCVSMHSQDPPPSKEFVQPTHEASENSNRLQRQSACSTHVFQPASSELQALYARNTCCER